MVIEVSVGGGLVPPEVRVSDSLPRTWIAGDGRYLRQAPGGLSDPALIALEERRIPDTAISGLIDDARTAGLLDEKPDFGNPGIADAMVTRVVVVTGDQRHTAFISALGYPDPGLTDAEIASRAKLSDLLDKLNQPDKVARAGEPSPYKPAAIAVYVLKAADGSATIPPATWPLGDLGNAGAGTDWPDRSARCFVVAGSDVTSVISAAAGKSRFTPWQAQDGLWDVALRPLLPDEHSCADVLS